MPLQIVRNDITKMECDAIVNAAKSSLLGGGGVDGAVHKVAGRKLAAECKKLGGCKVGEAKVTGGYNLPSKYVIHTVGPKWKGGQCGERELLESCYRKSLELAADMGCKSVAFPLISSGTYGYPKDKALKVAVDIITDFLIEHDMTVYIVVFDKSSYGIGEKLFADIASYIDDRYVDTHSDFNRSRFDMFAESAVLRQSVDFSNEYDICEMPEPCCICEPTHDVLPAVQLSLEEAVNRVDESFSQMLLRKIDEKGMTDAECYKKANVDRKLFSKIRGDVYYHPKKTTAIAFAVALELSMEETKDMLMKAGFALSHSSKFDIIIEYFISNGNYNVFEINEALFAFDQSLLGV